MATTSNAPKPKSNSATTSNADKKPVATPAISEDEAEAILKSPKVAAEIAAYQADPTDVVPDSTPASGDPDQGAPADTPEPEAEKPTDGDTPAEDTIEFGGETMTVSEFDRRVREGEIKNPADAEAPEDASASIAEAPAADVEAASEEDNPGWFEVVGGHPDGKQGTTDVLFAKNKHDARGKYLQTKPPTWETTSIKRTKEPKEVKEEAPASE